ncbi:hypothetical protein HK101_004827 [Irineochytrium annulatum]|nr:hypothetical protein HK101_004827 [Irineochytrium annulatum]
MERFLIDALYILHNHNADRTPKLVKWPQYIDPSGKGRHFRLLLPNRITANIYTTPGFPLRYNTPDRLSVQLDGTLIWNGEVIFQVEPRNHIEGRQLWDTPTGPVCIFPPLDKADIAAVSTVLRKVVQDNESAGLVDYSAALMRRLKVARHLAKEKIERTQQRTRDQSLRDDREYEFNIGDRVWLAVPYKAASSDGPLNTKFLFKWAGPMRIISQDAHRFDLIETLADVGIITHLATAGRMRPHTDRRPVDSAEGAADLAGDDYAADLEKIKAAQVFLRKPSGLQTAIGINPKLRRRFEDDYDEKEDQNDLEYEIDFIVTHGIHRESKSYTYKVKYKGYSHAHDDWHLERDLQEGHRCRVLATPEDKIPRPP